MLKVPTGKGKHSNPGGWMCQSFTIQATTQFFEELKANGSTLQIFAEPEMQL